MPKKKESQEQKQEQHITVAHEEHGITDWVYCEFYTDTTVEETQKWAKKLGPQGIGLYDTLQRQKRIKVLIYKGEIKRVFCHHYCDDPDGSCGAQPLEQGGYRDCHIIDQVET